MHAPADIFLAGLGDHRSVGFEIVLDADDEIAREAKRFVRKEYSVCLTVLPWLRIAIGSSIISAIGLAFPGRGGRRLRTGPCDHRAGLSSDVNVV